MLTIPQLQLLLERLYEKEPRIASNGVFSMWRINNMILHVQEQIHQRGFYTEDDPWLTEH